MSYYFYDQLSDESLKHYYRKFKKTRERNHVTKRLNQDLRFIEMVMEKRRKRKAGREKR